MTGIPENSTPAAAAGTPEQTVDGQVTDSFLAGGESLRHAAGPYFGAYGGRWMPESLIAALDELTETFEKAKADPEFTAQIAELNKNYSGRPSLLTEAVRFAEHAGGVRIFLKRMAWRVKGAIRKLLGIQRTSV